MKEWRSTYKKFCAWYTKNKGFYDEGILTWGKTLTKDSDSGKGKNSFL